MALTDMPLWRKEDLGKPLPDSPHAISVCIPRWSDVVGYKKGLREITDALACGYPRFIYHPFYRRLRDELTRVYSGADQYVMALPSEEVAQKCVDFVGAGCVQETSRGVAVAIIPGAQAGQANYFWQHTGLLVSSRRAQKVLEEAPPEDGEPAKQAIKNTIASVAGADKMDVYLFPTGMAAIFTGYQTVKLNRGTKVIQLGFPYVDTLKIIQKFGIGSVYIPYNSVADLHAVECALKGDDLSAVFCEIPGNPLLHTIELPALSSMLKLHGVPLVIDNTLGPWTNINLNPYADIIVTSLTKFFSGNTDVMGGSLGPEP
jgi:cystathionine gamma-synthase